MRHHNGILQFHFKYWSSSSICHHLTETEWWGAGVVICLEQGTDLHMAQLMPLPLTVSCFTKIQIGFTFLVPAHLGSPGKRAVKRVCVCVPTPHLIHDRHFPAFIPHDPQFRCDRRLRHWLAGSSFVFPYSRTVQTSCPTQTISRCLSSSRLTLRILRTVYRYFNDKQKWNKRNSKTSKTLDVGGPI